MKMLKYFYCLTAMLFLLVSCNDKDVIPDPPAPLEFVKAEIDNQQVTTTHYDTRINPVLKISFNNAVNRQTVSANLTLNENGSIPVAVNYAYDKNDSVVILTPQ